MKQDTSPQPIDSGSLSSGVAESIQILLGKRLREQRHAKHWTQAKLAAKANMSRAAIANIETGRQRTSVVALVRLAGALECPTDSLLPSISDAEEHLKEAQRVSLSQKAPPMLKEALGSFNVSPESGESLEKALASFSNARR